MRSVLSITPNLLKKITLLDKTTIFDDFGHHFEDELLTT